MQVTVVRSVGILAGVWVLRDLMWPGGWPGSGLYVSVILPMSAAALAMVIGRRLWSMVGTGLLAASCAGYLGVHWEDNETPVVLLLWLAVILLVTDRHPDERALLLRICVSCVYGFTALAKTNPSFLAGDQLVWITKTRPHMGWAHDLMAGPVGVLLATATVVTEFWLAIGLWLPRWRTATAALGAGLHVILIPVAATSWTRGVLFLLVLNAGLLVMYPAFWRPVPRLRHRRSASRHIGHHCVPPAGGGDGPDVVPARPTLVQAGPGSDR